MSITTYSELQTAIAAHSHRDDVAAKVVEFIQLAESRLRTAFIVNPVLGLETEATLTANAAEIDLPADWFRSREAYIDGDIKQHLEIVPLGYMDSINAGSVSGKPEMMSITGSKIRLAPEPDGTYDLVLKYYAFPALSDVAPTNWLLTTHPKLYLSACLSEVFSYTQNEREMKKHEQIVDGLLGQITDGNDEAMWSQAPLEIRAS